MEEGFIKDDLLIREDSKIDDLFNLSLYRDRVSKKVLNLPNCSILAIKGPFGCGKSTLIHQIQKNSDSEKYTWINFDAWKYPERKEMWEGLILDAASQLGDRKSVVRKIEGKSSKSKVVDIVTDIIGAISEISGLDIVDKFIDIFKASPAKRIFELQMIFCELLSRQKKNIIFVIEDIDRSGGQGIFFLETLNQFLKDNESKFEKKIVAVVLISDESYKKDYNSYIKSVDYFENFNPSDLEFKTFVEAVFIEAFFSGEGRFRDNRIAWTGATRKSQIISFLESLIKEYPKTSLRTIKMIIRKAEMSFRHQQELGLDPDLRVTLCFEAARFFDDDKGLNFFESFKKSGVVYRGNIFVAFLYAMLGNHPSLSVRNHETNRD
jgi:predicted SnoaL-like aldol condensation-catalyzing enzyme